MDHNLSGSCSKSRTAAAATEKVRASTDNATANPAPGIQPRNNGVLGLIHEGQLADEVHRSLATVRRWRRLKIGPPYIVWGRDIWYRISAVEQWLISRERNFPLPNNATPRRQHQ
jgi:hypothetical protein